jgi:hypothetical protein
VGLAILIFAGILLLVFGVLWRLKPSTFRLSIKVWRLLHFELESASASTPRDGSSH